MNQTTDHEIFFLKEPKVCVDVPWPETSSKCARGKFSQRRISVQRTCRPKVQNLYAEDQ